ncbi:MAG: hypothetical protein J7M38_01540, partial [Armatimonadetes bacterium]|nr:hypothetical protein [Armatimonadota bacterium]
IWSVILTNLGVPLTGEGDDGPPRLPILQAADMTIDGNLEEWLCDIEDRNVTRWRHATPMPLRELPGVAYLMWDGGRLYFALQYSSADGSAQVTLHAGDRTLTLHVDASGAVNADAPVKAVAARKGLAPNPDMRPAPAAEGVAVALEVSARMKLQAGMELPVLVEAGRALYPAGAVAADRSTWARGTLVE